MTSVTSTASTVLPTLTHAGIGLLALAGVACLALAMERHQDDLFGKALPSVGTRWLRAAGVLALVLSLWLAIARMGWGLGLTVFSGHTSAAAGVVFITLLAWNRWRTRNPRAG